MAREGLGSHLSGSVPVSIIVHAVLLLVLVVIPLASDIVPPIPVFGIQSYVLAAPLPPPPSVQPVHATATAPPRETSSIPTSAPPTLEPEPPAAAPFTPLGDIDNGLPPGFGPDTGALPGPGVPPPPPPVPENPPAPVRAAQLPELPRKTVDVHPIYPDVARVAHVEGTVILEAVLDTSGRVTQLRVLRSVPLLDQAALEAVRQWRYTPSIYYGKPVSVLMTITVRFTLQQ